MPENLLSNLYTAEKSQELDRVAIEEFQIQSFTLMQRAAKACYRRIKKRIKRNQTIYVFCGKGNNGGDGFLVANLGHEEGFPVRICYIGSTEQIKGDALRAYNLIIKNGISVLELEDLPEFLHKQTLIVDGILGTGIQGQVREPHRKAIEYLNAQNIDIVSIDIPSGLSGNTGKILGIAVKAIETISFIGLKQGLFTGDGPEYSGHIRFDSLSIPEGVYEKVNTSVRVLKYSKASLSLPSRKKTSHKGDFGHTLLIGGDYGMVGAISMAAEAAARTGAGLISVATRPENCYVITMRTPEIMTFGIHSDKDLDAPLNKASCVVIGPGLGTTNWAIGMLNKVIDKQTPIVFDADALNLISSNRVTFQRDQLVSGNWIMTPHPGEASRLLSTEIKNIEVDRFESVRLLQMKLNGISVLKGAGTLVYDGKTTWVCECGNHGMAKGGMGDILSGILGGLLSQGMSLMTAAKAGVILHSKAADLCAQKKGERGMLATDLFPFLMDLLK